MGIQSLRSGLAVQRAKKYALQIVQAVYFMHCHGYCHLDLSLENVVWDKERDCMKLCDFGLCRRLNADNSNFEAATIRPGKKGYMAPEIYAYQRFDGQKADCFSLGVIIFILLTGFPPFTTPNASDKCFQYMYYGKMEWLLKQWKLHEIIDQNARNLLSKILCHPKKRISIKDILEHPWFDGMDTPKNIVNDNDSSSEGVISPILILKESTGKKKRKSIVKKKRNKHQREKEKEREKRIKIKKNTNTKKVGINSTKSRSKSICLSSSETLLSEFGATVSSNDDKDNIRKKMRSKSLTQYSPIHHSFIEEMERYKDNICTPQTRHGSISSIRSQSNHQKNIECVTIKDQREESPVSTLSNQSNSDHADNDDHKQHKNKNKNIANLRQHLNETQLITMSKQQNNGNFTPKESESDNYCDDRKEGDDETYPMHSIYHERNSQDSQHSNHSELDFDHNTPQNIKNIEHHNNSNKSPAPQTTLNFNNNNNDNHPPV